MEKVYTAKEINEYMGYEGKSQQNNNKQQLMARAKNAGLILEDLPTKRGCANKYKIIEDNFKIEGEEWVPCYCYNEWEVSNLGRVRRISTKNLLGAQDPVSSYVMITGKEEVGGKRRYSVHRLIYFSFHPDQVSLEGDLVIDHINGQRNDNRLENLRALSSRENITAREENNKRIQEILGRLIIEEGYEKVLKYLESYKTL